MAAVGAQQKTDTNISRDLYKAWIEGHLKSRKGEERRRLEEGHQYAEKLFATQIWLPAVGHFKHLYPEYALTDYRDKARFVDFAYIRPPYRICIEIDGYGPHVQQASRRSFADGLMRQNQLVLDDWRVFRFSVDDLEQQTRKCQQMILHLLGKWYGGMEKKEELLSLREAQIVHTIIAAGAPMTPGEVADKVGMNQAYVGRLLRQICMKGYLRSADCSTTRRLRRYLPTFHQE
ncbi:MarR family winged helix-turn-helix transcriptional regulator [Paenibacillus kobensis]|uniref:MarR family winged helix-turn-helix transcriptional regulator n=1 Tax=Paenibacillus kobensis TaxID=59841 RepID=UPI000FD74FE2|nr:MarR family winged helix-turn-helix transcriptional regulator [Paenibacillus kobensis]